MDDPRWTAACAEFESLGESVVRVAVNNGDWKPSPPKHAYAQEWLRLRDEGRASEASSRRDARERKTLVIAFVALIVSAIAAHKEISWVVAAINSWLH